MLLITVSGSADVCPLLVALKEHPHIIEDRSETAEKLAAQSFILLYLAVLIDFLNRN
jgi:hypothetical protein